VCDLVLAAGGRSVLSDEKRLIKHLLDHYETVGVIDLPVKHQLDHYERVDVIGRLTKHLLDHYERVSVIGRLTKHLLDHYERVDVIGRLIKHLLDHYERVGMIGRPVDNTSKTVSVSYGMSLIQILDVDEKNQVLTINIWSRYVRIVLLLLLLARIAARSGRRGLLLQMSRRSVVCLCLGDDRD